MTSTALFSTKYKPQILIPLWQVSFNSHSKSISRLRLSTALTSLCFPLSVSATRSNIRQVAPVSATRSASATLRATLSSHHIIPNVPWIITSVSSSATSKLILALLLPTSSLTRLSPRFSAQVLQKATVRCQRLRLDTSSPELMSALRAENLRSDLTEKREIVVQQIKAQIVDYLKGGSFNSRRLADIVNYIRLNPESFSEWHKSVIAQRFANGGETAKLFAPPVFRNAKKASGYFFA